MALDNHTADPLVSSADVNGTTVYGKDGNQVGEIDHLMIDKQSGKVSYAVMSFGGFLGLGEDHYSVPWGKLNYDTSKGGFVTDITQEQLTGAPERPNDWYNNRDWEKRTHDYYAAPYYWI
ncbi:PRC-barrel domain-containing protein [Gymnodinialimonas ceratoperidinii]|uniref:PRC-barrel domain-containing protein n=1 Tax=Gymnodinialimonas ceratoperidinii TaxID=2856823 RepID=A0A8F6YE21_9RHOB|nr:PRC-barrel domain-containing protein [Gymnodinialimonas ceratoperidinii]QXT40777.1 PRC-barrel domain-containing protein [Gymnodinialimonas ceratoperidinii]